MRNNENPGRELFVLLPTRKRREKKNSTELKERQRKNTNWPKGRQIRKARRASLSMFHLPTAPKHHSQWKRSRKKREDSGGLEKSEKR